MLHFAAPALPVLPPRRGKLPLLLLVAVALGSCGGSETTLLFTVGAGGSATGEKLRMIAINEAGRVPGAVLLPDDGRSLILPGTLAVKVANRDSLVGLLIQLENDRNQVVARGRTTGCVSAGDDKSQLGIALQPSFASWEADFVARCSCAGENARDEMCPLAVVGVDGGVPPPDAAVQQMPSDARPSGDAAPPVNMADADVVMPPPSPPPDVAGPPVMTNSSLFGFEDQQAWTSAQLTLSRDTAMRTQGDASLQFTGSGQSATIVSRAFRTNELQNPTTTLNMDVYVTQQQDFSASVQLVLHCPNAMIFDQYLTWHALQPLPAAKWSTLKFTLPAEVVTKLKQNAEGCVLRIAHQGAGVFRLDNLAFAP